MFHHVERRHAASLAANETNAKTARYKDNFKKSETEKAAVAKSCERPSVRLSERP